jgi:hypothetical protein
MQIGLIILAMVVTRSSALSLQAKNGLPRGNQIVGWAVLGMHSIDQARFFLTLHSFVSTYAILAPPTA